MNANASTRPVDTSPTTQAQTLAPNASVQTWLPLLEEALQREGFFRWHLRGASMWPTLLPESEILIKPKPKQLRLGAIIVFAQGDALIAHRLVHHRDSGWVTQGDASKLPDAPLQPEQILGVVVAAYQQGHCYWPSRSSPIKAWRWIIRYHIQRLKRKSRRLL